MKVTVTFEHNMNEDGVDTKTTYEHQYVTDVQDLAWVFAESARAGGFTYIEQVALVKENGDEVWSLA
jgi:hypothetical protein